MIPVVIPGGLLGRVSPVELAVVAALVRWPGPYRYSHAELAWQAGVSVRSVRRALASLRAAGWVRWSERSAPDGARLASVYEVAWDGPWEVEP